MTIRLNNLSKWALLTPGNVFSFPGTEPRRVRIEFNCEAPTRIDVYYDDPDNDGDSKGTFVAVVMGMETVEFTAPPGAHLVATSDGEVWYFTNEGDQIANTREQVSFTRVMSRRSRNPELERMMFKMEQNMNRRMNAQLAEVEARYAAEGVRHDTATGEVNDDGDERVGAADAPAEENAGQEVTPAAKPAKGKAPAAEPEPDLPA